MSWGARKLTIFDGTTYLCYRTFMRKLVGNIFLTFSRLRLLLINYNFSLNRCKKMKKNIYSYKITIP